MINKIIALCFIFVICACTNPDHSATDHTDSFDIICLGGVQYWSNVHVSTNRGALSVRFTQEGHVVLC